MELVARNVLKSKAVEVENGQTTTHVRIDIDGSVVTTSITNEAIDDLALEASAIIKAFDVLVGK